MDRHALICRNILERPQITQRELAQAMDISLGSTNRLIKECLERNLMVVLADGRYEITSEGR